MNPVNSPAALVPFLEIEKSMVSNEPRIKNIRMVQHLIREVKRLFEEKTGWGDSDLWNNLDFLELSVMICEQTGNRLSHVTLKRIWGKVRYGSQPQTRTLNTLVGFLGYRNWREFCVRNAEAQPQ